MKTIFPSVFIVESLRFEDEATRQEGYIISDILRMSGKESEYWYIRTKKELKAVLKRFGESNFRYLHMSSHGDRSSFELTLDDVSFDTFGKMAAPYLEGRRIFVSACEAASKELAIATLSGTGCYSLTGPMQAVGFGDAALTWASFYHLMFRHNPARMKGDRIRETLQHVASAFEVPMRHFWSSTGTSPVRSATFRPD